MDLGKPFNLAADMIAIETRYDRVTNPDWLKSQLSRPGGFTTLEIMDGNHDAYQKLNDPKYCQDKANEIRETLAKHPQTEYSRQSFVNDAALLDRLAELQRSGQQNSNNHNTAPSFHKNIS